jgi:succinoglycan biosynthesis protein ExoL
LEGLGVQSNVLAFERDYYAGKFQPGDYTSLGRIEHGRYLRRLVPLLRAIRVARPTIREADVVYAFGLDLLLLGWLASRALGQRPKLVYEVSDVREVLTEKGILSRALRWLEQRLVQDVDLLVTTSKAFIDGYYSGMLHMPTLRYQVIENKMDVGPVVPPPNCEEWDGTLRIGYFGLLRCRQSWEILKAAAERGCGRVQVYARGYPMELPGFEAEASTAPYVRFGGPYLVPDDLPDMYDQVDMVWACYPYRGTGVGNWRWARTNRFSEACAFQRPMFAQEGNEDGRVVESQGLGVCLDLSNIQASVDRILNINESDLLSWRHNIANLPRSTYLYTDEHRVLIEALL